MVGQRQWYENELKQLCKKCKNYGKCEEVEKCDPVFENKNDLELYLDFSSELRAI